MKQIFTVDGYKNIYDLEEIYCSLIKQNYIDTKKNI